MYSDSRSKRRRVNLGRSTNGCLTCRMKRVKCDEHQPSCHRCYRLRLECLRPKDRPALSDNKEPPSAIRECRRTNHQPRLLLPLLPRPQDESSPPSSTSTGTSQEQSPGIVEAEAGANETAGLRFSIDSTFRTVDIENFFMPILQTPKGSSVIDTSEPDNRDRSPLSSLSRDGVHWTQIQVQDSNDNLTLVTQKHPTRSPSIRDVLPMSFTLADSLTLTNEDFEALKYFEDGFSPRHTTKSSRWAVPALLLRQSWENHMNLGFLLAVSFYDLSILKDSLSFHRRANAYFQKGKQIFVQAMNHEISADHLDIIMSFFFIYSCMTRETKMDPQKIGKLSQMVLEYVKRYSLESVRTGPLGGCDFDNFMDEYQMSYTAPGSRQSLTARLILWLFAEDSFSSFYGCGGQFSSYLRMDAEKLNDLRSISRNAISLNWGLCYPADEIQDDILHFLPIDMLVELISVHRQITEYSFQFWQNNSKDKLTEIDHNLNMLECKYASVFQLAYSNLEDRSMLGVNSRISIILFHALQLYRWRCAGEPFGFRPSPAVRSTLVSIVTLAHALCTGSSQQIQDRFQWALLIAGIETGSTIDREWILSKISVERLRKAMVRIITIKEGAGVVDMTMVRQIYRGEI